ncbi:MAG: hypothetical protein ACYSWU_27585 [Planctomycetota bacterium]|jgi:hypothetical protein
MAQKNDIGVIVTVTITEAGVAKDISTASVKKIWFRDPNGDELEKTAEFVTDGTDGKVKYTTIADDIDTAGPWRFQAKITTPAATFGTSWGEFTVGENIYT